MAVSFSNEDKKEVFNFFVEILKSFDDFVYYEYVRGHVSKAPPIVKKYVLKHCKGENLLNYFRKRRNYFTVDKYYVALKNWKKRSYSESDPALENSNENILVKKLNENTLVKNRNRNLSESAVEHESYSTTSSRSKEDDEERKVYEDLTINHFTGFLERHRKAPLDHFDLDSLPKKVRRFLMKNFNKKIRSFFLSFPGHFSLGDDDCVSLCISSAEKTEDIPPQEVKDIPPHEAVNIPPTEIQIDPELTKIVNYFEAIKFFVEVLRQKKGFVPIDKLSGYLSQSSNAVRNFIKYNYKTFSDFFTDPSFIFQINQFSEVTLSENYNQTLKKVKKFLKKALDGRMSQSEMTFKSQMDLLLKPRLKISSNDQVSYVNEIICKSPHIAAVGFAQEMQAKKLLNFNTDGNIEASTHVDYISDINKIENSIAHGKEIQLDKSVASNKEILEISHKIGTSADNEASKNPNIPVIKSANTIQLDKSSFSEIVNIGDTIQSDKIASNEVFSETSKSYDINDHIYKQNKLVEFIFTVELYCLSSFIEEIMNLATSETLEYFVPILEKNNISNLSLTRLYGYLGSSPLAVKLFIYKYYKRAKFKNFFKTYDEVFYIKSEFVELSKHYNGIENIELNKQFYLFMLYLETFSYLYELVKYVQSKGKIKLSRISNITTKYPHCDNWIKFTDGDSFEKQAANFLKLFLIFELNEGYIEYDSKNHSELLLPWLEKSAITYNTATDDEFLPLYSNYLNRLSEIKTGKIDEIVFTDMSVKSENLLLMQEIVQNELQSVEYLEYHKLPQILTPEILIDIIGIAENSMFIMENLFDNFDLFSGKITLKESNAAPISKENMQVFLTVNFMDKPFKIKKTVTKEGKYKSSPIVKEVASFKNDLKQEKLKLPDSSLKNKLISQTIQFSNISKSEEAAIEIVNNSIQETKLEDKIKQPLPTEQTHPINSEIATENKELLTSSENDLKQKNLKLPDNILENADLPQTKNSKVISKPEETFIEMAEETKLKHKIIQSLSKEQVHTINNEIAIETKVLSTNFKIDLKKEHKFPDNILKNDILAVSMKDLQSDGISESKKAAIEINNNSVEETKPEDKIKQPLSTKQINLKNSEISCHKADIKIMQKNIQIFEKKATPAKNIKKNDIQISISQNNNETLPTLEINDVSTLDHNILKYNCNNSLCSTNMVNEIQDNATSMRIGEDDIISDSKSDTTSYHLSNQQNDIRNVENESIYILSNELQDFLSKDKELSIKTTNKLSQEIIENFSTDDLCEDKENIKEINVISTETIKTMHNELVNKKVLEGFDISLNRNKSDSGFEEYVSYFLENNEEGKSASACSSVIDSSESVSSVLDDTESPVMNISISADYSVSQNSQEDIEMSATEKQKCSSNSEAIQFSNHDYTNLLCHNETEELSSTEFSKKENSFLACILSHEEPISCVPKNNLSKQGFYNNSPTSSVIVNQNVTSNFGSVTNEVITIDNCSIETSTLKDTSEKAHFSDNNNYQFKDSAALAEILNHDQTENLLIAEVSAELLNYDKTENLSNAEVSATEKFITDLLSQIETTNSLFKDNSPEKGLNEGQNYNTDTVMKNADISDYSKSSISSNSEEPSQNNLKKNINLNELFIDESPCLNTKGYKIPNISDEKDKHMHEEKSFLENSFDDKKIITENTNIETEENFQFLNTNLKDKVMQNLFKNNLCDKDFNLSSTDDNIQSNSNNGNKALIKQPLQPLTAEIALLTTDSCIAQASVESRLQTIYFLKSVFYCEKHDDCTECFNLLSVGDKVSCFIPVTEIEHKTWIAFMVSKESISDFERMENVNEQLLQHQATNQPIDIQNKMLARQYCSSSSSDSDDSYEERSLINLAENVLKTTSSNKASDDKCHSLQKNKELGYSKQPALNYCQTLPNTRKNFHEVMCQFTPSVKPVSAQASQSVKIKEHACQTENIFCNLIAKTTQTDKLQSQVDSSSQTEITGKIKTLSEVTDNGTQTYSTGEIMITKYSHS